ncbi:MAG: rRNA maturation RNase YbeY [Clostridia bacterium]|nr:rRNA maturation RNase YbeY [Clostridia bacterium]MDE6471920.1 rRNA maturation RNase YbeY [Clostridia bacterium]
MLEIYDEVESQLDTALIHKVFEEYKKHFALPDKINVELTIVDEDTIKEVNREYRGVDSVTDVLSFPSLDAKLPFVAEDYPMDIDISSGEIMLGEIMLCYSRAVEQSVEYGHSKERECSYLVLHGLLHLLGFDHIEQEDKEKMREQEELILGKLGIGR